MEKKKVKKKSKTAIINRLRGEIKELDESRWRFYREARKLEEEIRLMKRFVAFTLYRIEFIIKSKNDQMVNSKELVFAVSIEHAIEVVKINKIHPDTFKLTNVECLGK